MNNVMYITYKESGFSLQVALSPGILVIRSILCILISLLEITIFRRRRKKQSWAAEIFPKLQDLMPSKIIYQVDLLC